MSTKVSFYFHGSLNDFLLPAKKERWIHYTCQTGSTVKDSFEAIGVPHPEVKRVFINDFESAFTSPIHPDDKIEVYPYTTINDFTEAAHIHRFIPINYTFIADVHAGKLARNLRMLGFDVLYKTNHNDKDIATIAQAQNRIVLARDVGLLKQKIINHGYWLRSQNSNEQLTEILNRFNLKDKIRPFSRCLVCDGKLRPVAKRDSLHLIPSKTRSYFDEFFQCTNCIRVYWQGSHYNWMKNLINAIIQ